MSVYRFKINHSTWVLNKNFHRIWKNKSSVSFLKFEINKRLWGEETISSKIQRKIYSKDGELLSKLEYINFKKVKVTFLIPELLKIQLNSENVKEIIQNGLINKLTKKNQKIELNTKVVQGTNILREINFSGIYSVEMFNLITSNVIELVNLESGSGITAKIERNFYSEDNNLLCNVKYLDFDRVLIDFFSPDVQKIRKMDNKFKKYFIQRIVEPMIKENPELKIVYNYYEEEDILASIELIGIKSIEKFNFITSNLVDLW